MQDLEQLVKAIVREAFHATLDDRLSAAANTYWILVASRASVRRRTGGRLRSATG
jgi:hypothetical protein